MTKQENEERFADLKHALVCGKSQEAAYDENNTYMWERQKSEEKSILLLP